MQTTINEQHHQNNDGKKHGQLIPYAMSALFQMAKTAKYPHTERWQGRQRKKEHESNYLNVEIFLLQPEVVKYRSS